MKTLHLHLMEFFEGCADPNRPNISIWVEGDAGERIVSLMVKSLWGQPDRYIDLQPAEARTLAGFLTQAADGAEQ